MNWPQIFAGILIGLGLGLFLGGAIVDVTQKWNSTSAAGVSMLLVVTGVIAIQRRRRQTQPKQLNPNS